MYDGYDELQAARRLHMPDDVIRTTLREQAFALPMWLQPSDLSPEGVRSWLSSACENLGTTPSALALRAGLAASTLNRFVSGRTKGGSLNSRTVSLLAQTITALFAEIKRPESFSLAHFPKSWEIQVVGRIGQRFFRNSDRYSIKIPMPSSAIDYCFVAFEYIVCNWTDEEQALDLLVVSFLPHFDVRLQKTPQRVVYSSLMDGEPKLASGWCLVDPAGFGWIMPDASDKDAMPLPLGRERGLVHDRLLILGPAVTGVGFFTPTYEQ